MTAHPTIAFLGTGNMGFGMVQSLSRADLPVRVWNRAPHKARPLGEVGALLADTPGEAVAGADVVITMLSDGRSVLEVMRSATRSMSAGGVWLQCSTIAPREARRCERFTAAQGISFLDAPVLGSVDDAARGALRFLVSGPRHLGTRVGAVLDAMGSTTIWTGDRPGTGSSLKMVVDSWSSHVAAITAQTAIVAESLSVDPDDFLMAVSRGGVADVWAAGPPPSTVVGAWSASGLRLGGLASGEAQCCRDRPAEKGCQHDADADSQHGVVP